MLSSKQKTPNAHKKHIGSGIPCGCWTSASVGLHVSCRWCGACYEADEVMTFSRWVCYDCGVLITLTDWEAREWLYHKMWAMQHLRSLSTIQEHKKMLKLRNDSIGFAEVQFTAEEHGRIQLAVCNPASGYLTLNPVFLSPRQVRRLKDELGAWLEANHPEQGYCEGSLT